MRNCLCRVVPEVGTTRFKCSFGSFISGLGGLVSFVNPVAGLGMSFGGKMLDQADTNAANERNVAATNETNIQLQRMANEQSMANLEKQNENQVAQWQRENAYNDPSQQKLRLLAAGFNPESIVGNGNAQGVQFGSAPQAQAAKVQPYIRESSTPQQYANFVGSVMDLVSKHQSQKMAEYDLKMKGIDAAAHLETTMNNLARQIADLRNTQADTRYKKFELKSKMEELKYHQQEWNKMLRKMDQDFSLGTVQEKLMGQQIEDLVSQMNTRNAMTVANVRESLARIEHMKRQDVISMYEAKTGRIVSGVQRAKAIDDSNRLWSQFGVDKARYGLQAAAANLEQRLGEIEIGQRELTKDMITWQFARSQDKENALINKLLVPILGISTQDINFNLGGHAGFSRSNSNSKFEGHTSSTSDIYTHK